MKITIVLLIIASAIIVVIITACKKGGVQADVDAAIAQGNYQFVALLDANGKWTYPQVQGIPDWYFQTTGISVRMTKPETSEADQIYMKNYNDALYQTLLTQNKFHLILENVTKIKENLDKQKQSK